MFLNVGGNCSTFRGEKKINVENEKKTVNFTE